MSERCYRGVTEVKADRDRERQRETDRVKEKGGERGRECERTMHIGVMIIGAIIVFALLALGGSWGVTVVLQRCYSGVIYERACKIT
jgi:hypothetical protein